MLPGSVPRGASPRGSRRSRRTRRPGEGVVAGAGVAHHQGFVLGQKVPGLHQSAGHLPHPGEVGLPALVALGDGGPGVFRAARGRGRPGRRGGCCPACPGSAPAPRPPGAGPTSRCGPRRGRRRPVGRSRPPRSRPRRPRGRTSGRAPRARGAGSARPPAAPPPPGRPRGASRGAAGPGRSAPGMASKLASTSSGRAAEPSARRGKTLGGGGVPSATHRSRWKSAARWRGW